MNQPTTDPPDLALVKKACSELFAHFDSVQIFATRSDGERGTVNINFGLGDWFSRYGHARMWTIREEECEREKARRAQSQRE